MSFWIYWFIFLLALVILFSFFACLVTLVVVGRWIVNFTLLSSGFCCISSNSVGLCSSKQLSHLQISLRFTIKLFLRRAKSNLYTGTNLAPLQRHNTFSRILPNALWITRSLHSSQQKPQWFPDLCELWELLGLLLSVCSLPGTSHGVSSNKCSDQNLPESQDFLSSVSGQLPLVCYFSLHILATAVFLNSDLCLLNWVVYSGLLGSSLCSRLKAPSMRKMGQSLLPV